MSTIGYTWKEIQTETAGHTNRIVVSYLNLHNGWNCYSRNKNGRQVKLKKRKTVKVLEFISPYCVSVMVKSAKIGRINPKDSDSIVKMTNLIRQ